MSKKKKINGGIEVFLFEIYEKIKNIRTKVGNLKH